MKFLRRVQQASKIIAMFNIVELIKWHQPGGKNSCILFVLVIHSNSIHEFYDIKRNRKLPVTERLHSKVNI